MYNKYFNKKFLLRIDNMIIYLNKIDNKNKKIKFNY